MADSKIFQSYISLDMQPNRIRKFKTLALICFFTSCAGMLYQLINESRLDYNSVLIGFPFLFQNTDQLVNQLEDAIDKLLQDKAFVKRLKVE